MGRRDLRVVVVLLAGPWAFGCHALESLEDCQSDPDCPLGQRCHPQERFCEVDRGPVVMGASLALSGELEEFGTQMATGLDLAARQVNDSGGIRGRELRFEILDDESSLTRARENVASLIERRVAGIVGPLTSQQVLESQDLSQAAQVVQISPTAGSPELSTVQPATDRYLFRTISTVRSGSAAAIALFAHEGPVDGAPCRSMAILHTDDAIGVAYREAVEELFEKRAGCVSLTVDFPSGELVDYREQVTQVIDARPDCATVVALPEAGVELIGEFKQQAAADASHDWTGFFWIGTTTLHSESFLSASRLHPLDPAEGVYGGDEDSTPLTAEYNQLRSVYNAVYDRPETEDLPVFVSNTYDAAMLLALAVERAGSTADRVRIRDALWDNSMVDDDHTAYGPLEYREAAMAIARGDEIHYKGASSRLIFDEFGTVSNPTVVWKAQAGAFSVIGRYSEDEIAAFLEEPPELDPSCPGSS